MPTSTRVLAAALVAAVVLPLGSPAGAQLTPGQQNTFEDGTTQGWRINLLGMQPPPPEALPVNVPTGGPTGAGDNFLRLTSVGGDGAGSRLTALNFMGAWSGNYTAAGIGAIALDAINLGQTDLQLRILFENPTTMGPPSDLAASATAMPLAAGGGWTRLIFPIVGPGGLAPLPGSDLATLLANTTSIRIYHSPTLSNVGPPIVAQLGVDNITAIAAVPEPSTLTLLGTGIVALVAGAVRRRRGR